MENNQLPADVSKRIWADAEKYAEEKVKAINDEHFNVYWAYIAGATAEAESKQKMIEDIEGVIKHSKGTTESVYVNALVDQLKQLAQQWKEGKEVGNE